VNFLMEPARLYEPPYTDCAPRRPEEVFGGADVDGIVAILRPVKNHAVPHQGTVSGVR